MMQPGVEEDEYGAEPLNGSVLLEEWELWHKAQDKQGRSYYYHERTGETTWHRPACLGEDRGDEVATPYLSPSDNDSSSESSPSPQRTRSSEHTFSWKGEEFMVVAENFHESTKFTLKAARQTALGGEIDGGIGVESDGRTNLDGGDMQGMGERRSSGDSYGDLEQGSDQKEKKDTGEVLRWEVGDQDMESIQDTSDELQDSYMADSRGESESEPLSSAAANDGGDDAMNSATAVGAAQGLDGHQQSALLPVPAHLPGVDASLDFAGGRGNDGDGEDGGGDDDDLDMGRLVQGQNDHRTAALPQFPRRGRTR